VHRVCVVVAQVSYFVTLLVDALLFCSVFVIYQQWRPKPPPAMQNVSQKSLGDKNKDVKGETRQVCYHSSPSPPVWCFSSWKAPEDRCYYAKFFSL